MNTKRNVPLLVALSLPVLMIGMVALTIYWPAHFEKFGGEFLYAVPSSWSNQSFYAVINGRLQKLPVAAPPAGIYAPTVTTRLYLHDVVKNVSRDITFEEAQALVLDAGPKSAQGFEIVHGSQSQEFVPFLFFSQPDYSTVYIRGRHASRKMDVRLNTYPYNGQFQFLGWIKHD